MIHRDSDTKPSPYGSQHLPHLDDGDTVAASKAFQPSLTGIHDDYEIFGPVLFDDYFRGKVKSSRSMFGSR